MADRAGRPALHLHHHRLAICIQRLDYYAPRTQHHALQRWQAQAALCSLHLPLGLHDPWIYQPMNLWALLIIIHGQVGDYHHTHALADLRSRKADARRIEHSLDHIIEHLQQSVIYATDAFGFHPQHRVTTHQDFP